DGLFRGGDDRVDVESVFLQQFKRLTAFAKAVVDGYHFEGSGIEPGKYLCHRATEASVHLVFFAGNTASGFLYGVEYGFGIERLDGVNVDHLSADPHFSKFFFRLDREPYHVAAGEQGHIFALDHGVGLANSKWTVFLCEDGPAWPPEPEVRGSDVIAQRDSGSPGLVIVARHDNGHAGNHLHHTDVFQYLVCGAILAEGQPRVRCADFYILAGIGDRLPDLVI